VSDVSCPMFAGSVPLSGSSAASLPTDRPWDTDGLTNLKPHERIARCCATYSRCRACSSPRRSDSVPLNAVSDRYLQAYISLLSVVAQGGGEIPAQPNQNSAMPQRQPRTEEQARRARTTASVECHSRRWRASPCAM
jgi:hypothetical protein